MTMKGTDNCDAVLITWWVWESTITPLDWKMGIANKHRKKMQTELHSMFNCCFFLSISPSPWINEFKKMKCAFDMIILYSSLCLNDYFSFHILTPCSLHNQPMSNTSCETPWKSTSLTFQCDLVAPFLAALGILFSFYEIIHHA